MKIGPSSKYTGNEYRSGGFFQNQTVLERERERERETALESLFLSPVRRRRSFAERLQAAARLKGRELLAVKTASLERKLCEEIAGLAAGYDFAECACGRDLGAGRCALRARETSRYVGDDTEHLDYATLLVELDECSKTQRDAPGVGKAVGSSIKCSLVLGGAASFAEDGQTDAEDDSNESAPPVFDESQVAGQASHLYLHRCLHPVSSTEAADRVAKAPPLFHSSVEELLHLTRPFSFF